MKAVGAKTTGLKKILATWAKGKMHEHALEMNVGGTGEYPPRYAIADLLMGKIREKLGLGKVKYSFSGAAPLMSETLEYFASLGITIRYGML